MGKLQFDMVMRPTLLMQDRACDASETVAGHHALIAHALERKEYRVIAHGLSMVDIPREEQIPAPGDGPQ